MKTVNVPRSDFTDFLFYMKGMGLLDDFTICGSYGLKLNGLLERDCHDLDILTHKSWYGWNPFRGTVSEERGSHRFSVGDQNITCTKVKWNNLKIDLLYNEAFIEYPDSEKVRLVVDICENYSEYVVDSRLREVIVNVENSLTALKFKRQYMENDRSEESKEKHKMDLIDILLNKGVRFDNN